MDKDDIIETLNDLIETSKDGEYGFRTSAENVEATHLRQLFERRADACRDAVSELQAQVVRLGGKPDTRGSIAGAMHRGWVSAKSALSRMPALSILEETERGEDTALARYAQALANPDLPEDVRALVQRQYEGVKRNHAEVRALRDQLRNTQG